MAQAVAAPSHLEPIQPMPAAARSVLKSRMVYHARDMHALMSAIMVLDYPTIHGEALAIADNANLSRPLSGDATELNSLLPETFFLYQDQLRHDARTLAAAADQLNPFDTAASYGRLSESCVRCHAVYRGGR
jgi:acyl-CoA synthetase (NDP forming)